MIPRVSAALFLRCPSQFFQVSLAVRADSLPEAIDVGLLNGLAALRLCNGQCIADPALSRRSVAPAHQQFPAVGLQPLCNYWNRKGSDTQFVLGYNNSIRWCFPRQGFPCRAGTVPQATFTLPFPASISVPAGIPVNTALTPWVKVASAIFFACRALLPRWSVALGYRPLSLADTGHRYNFNGVAYTVFRTNVPGIGLAVQVVANPHGSPGVRRDLGTPGGAPPPWVGDGWGNSDGWFHQLIPLGGEVSATLVKTGPISDGREIMPSTVAEAAWWETGMSRTTA